MHLHPERRREAQRAHKPQRVVAQHLGPPDGLQHLSLVGERQGRPAEAKALGEANLGGTHDDLAPHVGQRAVPRVRRAQHARLQVAHAVVEVQQPELERVRPQRRLHTAVEVATLGSDPFAIEAALELGREIVRAVHPLAEEAPRHARHLEQHRADREVAPQRVLLRSAAYVPPRNAVILVIGLLADGGHEVDDGWLLPVGQRHAHLRGVHALAPRGL
mmetsp:Transcript_44076/g.115840  ORF Transcript_44076/g.115840 Transcript_44076/m.115840 type:complete len:218 (-) Transcript_44076:563-1216(-)